MNIRNIKFSAALNESINSDKIFVINFTYEQDGEEFEIDFKPNEKGGFYVTSIWHNFIVDYNEDGMANWDSFDVTSNFKRSEILRIAQFIAKSSEFKKWIFEFFKIKVSPSKIYVQLEELDEFEENTYLGSPQEIKIHERANYEEWRQHGYTNPHLIDSEKNEELWRKAMFQPLLDYLNDNNYYKRKTEEEKMGIMDSMMYMGDNYTDGELFLYKNYWSRRYITINKWGVVTFKERRWSHVEKFEEEEEEGI